MTDEQRIHKLRTALAEATGAIQAASEILVKEQRPKTAAKFAEIAADLAKTLNETKPDSTSLDLLAALQLAVHVRGTSDDTPEVLNQMQAAIDKATGEKP